MDVQFYGANCLVFSNKELRIVVDDTLQKLGSKSITRADDVVLYTGAHDAVSVETRMVIDLPGEYELGNVSITGIPARSHLSEDKNDRSTTIYKIVFADLTYVVTGHIYPELSDEQLEQIGMVDVLFVPVGGSGYTMDSVSALKLARHIDPKILIPTHYDDKTLTYEVPQVSLDDALKELSMGPKERVEKLRVKPTDLSETTQLVILEKS